MPCFVAQFDFAAPAWLLGLIALAPLAWLAWASATRLSWTQRIASCVCRATIVVLVVLALAGLTEHWPSAQRRVVLLVDLSASTAGAGRQQAAEFLAAAEAARGEHEVLVAGVNGKYLGTGNLAELTAAARDHDLETDLAAGLRGALAELPADYVPQIVLLTDGRTTRGDLLATVAGLRVPVATLPLGPAAGPEVALVRAQVVGTGAAGLVRATLRANQPLVGQVQLRVDGAEASAQQVSAPAGEIDVDLSLPGAVRERDWTTVQVQLADFPDTDPRNNERTLLLARQEAAPLLLVRPAAQAAQAAPLAAALRAEGFRVVERDPPALQADRDLAASAVVFLVGVAPADLAPTQWTDLRRHVEERGLGLVVMGGPGTFAAERLAGSALEALAPVKSQVEATEREKVLALVLVIDRSTSMLEENRLALAKAAAKRAVEVLAPTDRVGVIAFGSEVQWIVEPGPAADRAAILAKIDSLEAEGLTNMFPALQRAALALEQARADRRQLILLTDGVPSPGDFGAVARELAAAGVRVTTVSISAGAEQSLLQEIARIAGGQHRHAASPSDLTGILEQEAQTAVRDLEGMFTPTIYRRLPRLSIDGLPPLDGGVAASPKNNSELLLIAERRNPLLSWWRVGRGAVVAFLAQPTGERAEQFARWPGFRRFFARLAEHAQGPPPPRSQVALHAAGDDLVATILPAPGAAVERVAVGLVGEEPRLARQIAPGKYQARLPGLASGTRRVQATVARRDASGPGERLVAGWVEAYPDELRYQPPDTALLKHIAAVTGGKFQPTPAELFAPDARRVERTLAWWPRLLLAALLLLVLDVALRRWTW